MLSSRKSLSCLPSAETTFETQAKLVITEAQRGTSTSSYLSAALGAQSTRGTSALAGTQRAVILVSRHAVTDSTWEHMDAMTATRHLAMGMASASVTAQVR